MSTKAFALLPLFACICVYSGLSSTAQTSTNNARFAIEFPDSGGLFPIYATIPEDRPCTTVSSDGTLKRLANGPNGVELPSELQLEICVKGDTIIITPSVVYIDSNPLSAPTPVGEPRRQTLTTHTGMLQDSVKFTEMEQVGLEPITVRIVSAQPEVSYHPRTRSDVSSIQIDYTPVDRSGGKLTLRNSSSKAVDAFKIGRFQEAGLPMQSSLESYRSNGWPSVIAPGASHEMLLGMEHSGRRTNGSFIEDPPPQLMVLQSVLFSDGSYEGDPNFVPGLAARVFGAEVQLLRISHLAEPILADGALDDQVKIERIRTAIQRLSTQADPETIAQFHAKFAQFSGELLTAAERDLGFAMKNQNEVIVDTIADNEPIFLQHPSRLTLKQWWTTIILKK